MASLTGDERDAILISMNENMKLMSGDIKGLKQQVTGLETRIDRIETNVTNVERDLAKKPDDARMRQIVHEEVDDALSTDTFRLTRVK
jgi:hypothetical protein